MVILGGVKIPKFHNKIKEISPHEWYKEELIHSLVGAEASEILQDPHQILLKHKKEQLYLGAGLLNYFVRSDGRSLESMTQEQKYLHIESFSTNIKIPISELYSFKSDDGVKLIQNVEADGLNDFFIPINILHLFEFDAIYTNPANELGFRLAKEYKQTGNQKILEKYLNEKKYIFVRNANTMLIKLWPEERGVYEKEDFIQYQMIKLVNYIDEKWDPSYGREPTSCIGGGLVHRIIDELRKNSMYHSGKSPGSRRGEIHKEISRIEQSELREAEYGELLELFEGSSQELNEILGIAFGSPIKSIEIKDEDSISTGYIEDNSEPNLLDVVDNKMKLEAIDKAITQLPPQYVRLLFLYIHKQWKFEDIGAEFGIHKGNVSHMYYTAIDEIKRIINKPNTP